MTEHLLVCVLLGIPAAYLLRVLLLDEMDSHEGPFQSARRTVKFPDSGHEQSVALWDWLRRPFGVYEVKGDTWVVRLKRAERFTCPFCLSFWTSLVLSVPYWLLTMQPLTLQSFFWLLVFHFTIAVSSRTVYRYALE